MSTEQEITQKAREVMKEVYQTAERIRASSASDACTQSTFAPDQTWLTRGGWVERIKSVHSFMSGKPITCASGRLYSKEGRFLATGRDSEHDLIRQIDLDEMLSATAE